MLYGYGDYFFESVFVAFSDILSFSPITFIEEMCIVILDPIIIRMSRLTSNCPGLGFCLLLKFVTCR